MKISSSAAKPKFRGLKAAATLPPELAKRAEELAKNPEAYPFPSRSVLLDSSFEKTWNTLANPTHWEDDFYHNQIEMQGEGQADSFKGAWFDMSHKGFPLQPTVFGTQDFAGVIVESKVEGEPGQRTGKVVLAELNRSGAKGWKAIPEHLQSLTIKERPQNQVEVEIGVKTAPSESPEWLRKNILKPWATWHIEIDEADKLRHITKRIQPESDVKPVMVKTAAFLGAIGGLALGGALGSNAMIGSAVGGVVGGALSYFLAGQSVRKSG